MILMAKKTVELGQLINLFPAPVVLVTSKSEERENIIAIAWCGIVCSQPPMVSISIRPSRYSSEIIKQSGEFVAAMEKVLDVYKRPYNPMRPVVCMDESPK